MRKTKIYKLNNSVLWNYWTTSRKKKRKKKMRESNISINQPKNKLKLKKNK